VPLIEPAPGTQLPPGSYDPQGEWPDNIPCACCRSAVSEDVPEGWKNRRGNTSVVVRKHTGGRTRNVVVDVGKTFKEQTQRFFPKWGIETIDAVILTHGREFSTAV
jgi:phosphoribosyl 1,2-cyclic phosphodiesterase